MHALWDGKDFEERAYPGGGGVIKLGGKPTPARTGQEVLLGHVRAAMRLPDSLLVVEHRHTPWSLGLAQAAVRLAGSVLCAGNGFSHSAG